MATQFNIAILISFLVLYFYFIFSKTTQPVLKIVLLVGGFYMSLFPFLLSKKVSAFMGDFFPLYANGLNTIFVAIIILFCLLLISKITRIYAPTQKFAIVLLIVSALLSLYSLYSGLKVPAIKEVTITSKKISKPQKLVFLSDIHITKNLSINKIKGLVKKVNQQNPDVIILGGDVIDDNILNSKPYLEELKELKAKKGVYFATGNHEFYRGILTSVGQLHKAGFKYLFNKGVLIGGNVFVGAIPDVRTQKNQVYLEEVFKNSTKDNYNILASHTPYNFGVKNNFDLMLSGHTHGGQIFPFHILAKIQNKYLAGFYNIDNNAKIYVSRGSGQWGPQLRFLAPAEITVINLLPTKK